MKNPSELATLTGTDFQNYGVTSIGQSNVTIRGGHLHGYYYGIRVENGSGIQIESNDLSENWVDPASLGDNPPFLAINVGPDLGDRTNLGDGLGDTDLPYTNSGQVDPPGDLHPLIGSPAFEEYSNPRVHCGTEWLDLGPNLHPEGDPFGTANGAHFATDGTALFLLEGNNDGRLDRFDFTTGRYQPLAAAPVGVADGGDFQYAGGPYAATVGLQFNEEDGSGIGS